MRGAWAAAVLLVGTFCWAGPQPGTEVFAAPLTARIEPDSIPKSARAEAQLRAARGSVESFFILVRTKPGATVEATASALSGPFVELSAAQIKLSQVLFAESKHGKVADIVVPLPSGGVRARAAGNLPLLVEVTVPKDATPGTYEGAIDVRIDGELARAVPLRLKVLRAALPATASLPTAFGFDGRGAWMLHGGDTQARRDIAQRYAKSALSHRISLIGGSGLAPAAKDVTPGEGWLKLDFTEFDRELAPLMDGVAELSGAKATAVAVRTPQNLTSMERFKYVLAVRKHLREKGWTKALVLVDGVPAFAKDQGKVAEVIVECEGVTACRNLALAQSPRPWWRLTASGAEGDVSVAVGADPMKLRAIGWSAFQLNVAGLRLEDASQGFTDAAVGGPVGPGALFYPPRTGGTEGDAPIESVRLKLIRDGLQDYELLKLADTAKRDRARIFLGELTPGLSEEARMDALREILDGEEPPAASTQAGSR